jgi:2,5-dihydroxypyridine 5,6-dioxygenase
LLELGPYKQSEATVASTLLLKKGVLSLRHCLGAKAGDDLLVLHDETICQELIDVFMYAATSLGTQPHALSYASRRRLFMEEYGLFGGAWSFEDPIPKIVMGAMARADAILVLSSDIDFFFSDSLKQILGTGKRLISLPYLTTEEMLVRLLPADVEEINRVRAKTKRYFEALNTAKHAKVLSRGGTDIEMGLGEFGSNCSTGVIEQGLGFLGGLEVLPGGQVTRVPNTNSANGVLVIDRSIGAYEYGPLYDNIILDVEEGRVVNIRGQREAERLRRFLNGLSDPSLFHLTELGIGLNERCRFTGVAAPAEDTHTAGCVSMALGTDFHLKGKVRAKAHLDSTMWFATLQLDDQVVVKDGDLTL